MGGQKKATVVAEGRKSRRRSWEVVAEVGSSEWWQKLGNREVGSSEIQKKEARGGGRSGGFRSSEFLLLLCVIIVEFT